MDFNTIDKILDSFQKHPKRTILILCLIVLIALSAVFLKSYIGQLGKNAASDSGEGKKASTGIQIGEIKTGDRSQVIVGNKVIISGVSPKVIEELSKTLNLKVIERLLKTLDEKDVALQDRVAKLQELARKYEELEKRLAKRSVENDIVAQAKEKLDKGDLEGAEELLLKSLEKNLKIIAEKKKAAASDAFELGSLKELQLDYHSAKKYYEQAVQIEPDNTEYLNNFGSILKALGEHNNAIKNYEKALAIDLKVYGDQHPSVALDYNNLGMAWYSLGKYQKAIDYIEKALAIDLKVYGKQHPHTKTVKSNLENLKETLESNKNQ